jgi:hypothetical protein
LRLFHRQNYHYQSTTALRPARGNAATSAVDNVA